MSPSLLTPYKTMSPLSLSATLLLTPHLRLPTFRHGTPSLWPVQTRRSLDQRISGTNIMIQTMQLNGRLKAPIAASAKSPNAASDGRTGRILAHMVVVCCLEYALASPPTSPRDGQRDS